MNCETARKVWNHPEGLISGLREYLPGVLEGIESRALAFASGKSCAYNDAVHEQAGDGCYYVEHALTDDDPLAIATHEVVGDVTAAQMIGSHISELVSREVGREMELQVGNLCCGGCMVFEGVIEPSHLKKIQMAAVNTDPIE